MPDYSSLPLRQWVQVGEIELFRADDRTIRSRPSRVSPIPSDPTPKPLPAKPGRPMGRTDAEREAFADSQKTSEEPWDEA